MVNLRTYAFPRGENGNCNIPVIAVVFLHLSHGLQVIGLIENHHQTG